MTIETRVDADRFTMVAREPSVDPVQETIPNHSVAIQGFYDIALVEIETSTFAVVIIIK